MIFTASPIESTPFTYSRKKSGSTIHDIAPMLRGGIEQLLPVINNDIGLSNPLAVEQTFFSNFSLPLVETIGQAGIRYCSSEPSAKSCYDISSKETTPQQVLNCMGMADYFTRITDQTVSSLGQKRLPKRLKNLKFGLKFHYGIVTSKDHAEAFVNIMPVRKKLGRFFQPTWSYFCQFSNDQLVESAIFTKDITIARYDIESNEPSYKKYNYLDKSINRGRFARIMMLSGQRCGLLQYSDDYHSSEDSASHFRIGETPRQLYNLYGQQPEISQNKFYFLSGQSATLTAQAAQQLLGQKDKIGAKTHYPKQPFLESYILKFRTRV